ncbi:F-box protein [Candidatus Odyssella thessalonicensis]|uniref:F-box protein n=1 Tax=Candidatus Odyssella thessalonicensis TaxID=84647 RepID=UPI000225C11F|nr:F-box protein [Candidatus Odyssella thessalonicensis]
MVQQLASLLLLSTFTYGLDLGAADCSASIDKPASSVSPRLLSHPEDLLPCEIWEAILDYLPLVDQSRLAATHSYFRDDFFWMRRFKLHFPTFEVPTQGITSLCRYVLLALKFDAQFRDPLAITIKPETYDWMIQETFTDARAEKLTRYMKGLIAAKAEIQEIFENYSQSWDQEERDTRLECAYYKIFSAQGDKECREQLFSQCAYNPSYHKFIDMVSVTNFPEAWINEDNAEIQLMLASVMHNPERYHLEERSVRSFLEDQLANGNAVVQYLLAQAACDQKLGFTEQNGLSYLQERAGKGDQYAQSELINAAASQTLGFTQDSGLAYLQKQAAKGDQDAQYALAQAAYRQELGFTLETGRAYLEEQVAQGNEQAEYWLSRAAAGLDLGFTSATARTYLEVQTVKGDKSAQARLREAACELKLGFTPATARTYLEERAAIGDEDAQRFLNNVAEVLQLGFTPATARAYLDKRAASGDENAQQILSRAAYKLELGFTADSGKAYFVELFKKGNQGAEYWRKETEWDLTSGQVEEERVRYLLHLRGGPNPGPETTRAYVEGCAAAGDQAAQNYLNCAATRLWLGFTEESGYSYLSSRVMKWDGNALKYFREYVDNPDYQLPHLTNAAAVLQKAKVSGLDAQQQMIEFLLHYDPEQAIILRWSFELYNALLGGNYPQNNFI